MRWVESGVLLGLVAALSGCGSEPEVAGKGSVCDALTFTDRGEVRVFVIGHKQTLDDVVSYDAFERSYRRHVEAFEPCLAKDRPNLVVFPENAALGAFLLGARGESARAAENSTLALVEILKAYEKEFNHYKSAYPDLTLRPLLLLALTDVTWRAFHRTFSGIARDYGVWVVASADLAPAEETTDPTLVAALRDPEAPDTDLAYVAAEPTPKNSAYLFDPSGNTSGRVDKVFLTDPEENDLSLYNGSFSALDVLETPFARLGIATSRDAFYPPFMQRLEDLGANLVIQPEAFSGWTVEQLPGDWLPDVFLSSGWLHTQRYRTIVHSLNPVYTGNFFELVFDGQAHITGRVHPNRESAAYVGQSSIGGFVAVGPWAAPDPVRAEPTLSIDERRERLRELGKALLPGSGAATENAYIDSLVAADLELPTDATAQPITVEHDPLFAESQPVEGGSGGDQRNPDLTTDGTRLFAVWQDRRSGAFRIRSAISSDGKGFDASVEVAPGATSGQGKPAICAGGGRVAVAWQEGDGAEQVRVAVAPSDGSPFGTPIDVSVSPGWDPDCAFLPNGELVVSFSDVSSGIPRAFVARLPSGAQSFDAPVPLDPSTSALPRVQGTQVMTALSATGGNVAWLDYRDKSWDVYAARFDGAVVSSVQRVDAASSPDDAERLHAEPRVETLGQRVVVAWSDLRDRRGFTDIAFAVSDDGGTTFSERRLVPGGAATTPPRTAGGTAMPRFRPDVVLAADGGTLVFQDLSRDKSAIFRAPLGQAGVAQAPQRVDDTGESPVTLTHARAAALGDSVIVVWEDDRDGPYRIYMSRL